MIGTYDDFKYCKLARGLKCSSEAYFVVFVFNDNTVEPPLLFRGANGGSAGIQKTKEKGKLVDKINEWWKSSPHFVETPASQSEPVESVVVITQSTTAQNPQSNQTADADVVVVTE